jgi:hypothetical protein
LKSVANLHSSEFQRAFVAMTYLVGRRDLELLQAIAVPHEDARTLVRRLGHPERERRAEVLARELTPLVGVIEARTLK